MPLGRTILSEGCQTLVSRTDIFIESNKVLVYTCEAFSKFVPEYQIIYYEFEYLFLLLYIYGVAQK